MGANLTSLETDLLTLAASVFAADLAVRRQERESFVRDIQINVPLVNHHIFHANAENIAAILYVLSSDNWVINVEQRPGIQEQPSVWPTEEGTTLLFSGGLDSFSAAVELLESQRDCPLQLASHYTRNRVAQRSQEALAKHLRNAFGPRVTHVAVRAAGERSGDLPFPGDTQREATQRTRSFLFLVIGAIVARRRGFRNLLLMAENGQMAIHAPLTAARLGGFSTKTAHPEFLHEMQSLLSHAMNFPLTIENPFVYRTKAECIAAPIANHRGAIESSVSCWSSARQAHAHCGRCVPCLIRRIAVEWHGVFMPEYERDLFAEELIRLPDSDDGKRNFVDLADFVLQFSSSATDAQLQERFPDLRNPHIDIGRAIDMYRRFSQEALTVFARYPNIGTIL